VNESHEKLMIWGEKVPYNTSKSKIEFMGPIGKYKVLKFMRAIGKDFIDDIVSINAVTYKSEIGKGGAKETFDDKPYITPFIVPGSDRAVIVVPGGGYAYKSLNQEGEGIAKSLNEAGISAFVLWYRLNPYKAPVPYVDLQRAVRYVKYHAKKYGIDPKKVGIIGFSAGGHCCASMLNILRNSHTDFPEYMKDEIDKVDSSVALAGLLYPVINLKYNPGILFALVEPEKVRDEKIRNELVNVLNPSNYVQENDPPQFICYGDKDGLVDPKGVLEYKAKLDGKGVQNKLLVLKGANHGYGDCGGNFLLKLMNGKYSYWIKEFTNWANEIFSGVVEKK
jgi:acetyl esterase/lipase